MIEKSTVQSKQTRGVMARQLLLVFVLLATIVVSVAHYPTRIRGQVPLGVSVETRFGAGWETDSTGDFVWVTSNPVSLVIANNEIRHLSVRVMIPAGVAPCSSSIDLQVTDRYEESRFQTRSMVGDSTVIEMHLAKYERRILTLRFLNQPCRLTSTDGREAFGRLGVPEIKVFD